MPKMRHPQSNKAIDVAPDQVPMYESQGWQVKAAANKSSARPASTPANTATTKE